MALGLPSIYKVIKYSTDIECYDLLSIACKIISERKIREVYLLTCTKKIVLKELREIR